MHHEFTIVHLFTTIHHGSPLQHCSPLFHMITMPTHLAAQGFKHPQATQPIIPHHAPCHWNAPTQHHAPFSKHAHQQSIIITIMHCHATMQEPRQLVSSILAQVGGSSGKRVLQWLADQARHQRKGFRPPGDSSGPFGTGVLEDQPRPPQEIRFQLRWPRAGSVRCRGLSHDMPRVWSVVRKEDVVAHPVDREVAKE